MPSTKEIRGKIKSVQNTRKITKAMEMVAASKMRKAQDRMHAARPYGDKIRVICSHLARANVTDYSHPFLTSPEGAKKVGIILVSTDKGLAGALNTNIQRMLLQRFRDWSAEGVHVRPFFVFRLLNERESEVSRDMEDFPMFLCVGGLSFALSIS